MIEARVIAAITARILFIDSRGPDTLIVGQNFRDNKASPGAIEARLYQYYNNIGLDAVVSLIVDDSNYRRSYSKVRASALATI